MIRVYRNGKSYNFSDDEYNREVSDYNSRHGYGFSSRDLTELAKKHYEGDDRTKAILEERLTDANYHSYQRILSEDDYEAFESEMNKDYGKPKKRAAFFESLDKRIRERVGDVNPSKKAIAALAKAGSNG